MGLVELLEEADRQLTICNACRYCEGYCAVFPALERRSILMDGDVAYLATLCHDCRACYYACMYAPPHEFGVNLPEVLAEVRVETYRAYGWPAIVSRLLNMGITSTVLASLAAGIAVLGLILAFGPPHRLIEAQSGPGAFYRIVPYAAMAVPFLLLSAYAGVAMVARHRRSAAGPPRREGGADRRPGVAEPAVPEGRRRGLLLPLGAALRLPPPAALAGGLRLCVCLRR